MYKEVKAILAKLSIDEDRVSEREAALMDKEYDAVQRLTEKRRALEAQMKTVRLNDSNIAKEIGISRPSLHNRQTYPHIEAFTDAIVRKNEKAPEMDPEDREKAAIIRERQQMSSTKDTQIYNLQKMIDVLEKKNNRLQKENDTLKERLKSSLS